MSIGNFIHNIKQRTMYNPNRGDQSNATQDSLNILKHFATSKHKQFIKLIDDLPSKNINIESFNFEPSDEILKPFNSVYPESELRYDITVVLVKQGYELDTTFGIDNSHDGNEPVMNNRICKNQVKRQLEFTINTKDPHLVKDIEGIEEYTNKLTLPKTPILIQKDCLEMDDLANIVADFFEPIYMQSKLKK